MGKAGSRHITNNETAYCLFSILCIYQKPLFALLYFISHKGCKEQGRMRHFLGDGLFSLPPFVPSFSPFPLSPVFAPAFFPPPVFSRDRGAARSREKRKNTERTRKGTKTTHGNKDKGEQRKAEDSERRETKERSKVSLLGCLFFSLFLLCELFPFQRFKAQEAHVKGYSFVFPKGQGQRHERHRRCTRPRRRPGPRGTLRGATGRGRERRREAGR